MSLLSELATTTRTVTAERAPSVVRIGRAGGRGCGIVVAPGRVATNAHNLRGRQATVTFADGRAVLADVLGVDVDGDLAVLEADTGDLAPVTLASRAADTGDVVFTISRGPGGTTRTTVGTVSATERPFRGPRGRRIDGSLEHTAPLARGSSGSPVLDADGHLVGLNTNRAGDGFYLALPADEAFGRRLEALARGTVPTTRQLGIAVAPPHVARKLRRSVGLPDRDGLLIRGVEASGPADRAGLTRGDLVVRVGEMAVASVDDLSRALDTTDDELVLGIIRGAEDLELVVRFVESSTEGSDAPPSDGNDHEDGGEGEADDRGA
jgi:serine protease Do